MTPAFGSLGSMLQVTLAYIINYYNTSDKTGHIQSFAECHKFLFSVRRKMQKQCKIISHDSTAFGLSEVYCLLSQKEHPN